MKYMVSLEKLQRISIHLLQVEVHDLALVLNWAISARLRTAFVGSVG
jgi:hypothetical protein